MHRILERQIKRSFSGGLPPNASPELLALLQVVSDTYTHADEDRELLSRSLDLSSRDFVKVNNMLRSENEIVEKKVADRTQELEYEKTKLSAIAEHMMTGTILLDGKGDVTFLNQSALKLLDSPTFDKAIATLSDRFASVTVRERVENALKGNSSTVAEAEMNGRIFSISFDSLQSETGIFGALIWLSDITAQVLLDRAKDQFIAIASHEMRTPLAIIRGNAELMLDEPAIKSNPELTEETEHILKSVVRLLGIVNDFLDVQNLESRKIVLKPEKVELVKTLKDIITDISPLADKKNIPIEFKTENIPTDLCISIDRARLQQICTNFISNAIHYTDKGNIIVALEKTDTDVKILFTDSGIGIDAEDQARLFKKFATAKVFLKSKEYGSGLGLYISNLLATAMNCKVKLEKSEVGVGSTFSLSIPLVS